MNKVKRVLTVTEEKKQEEEQHVQEQVGNQEITQREVNQNEDEKILRPTISSEELLRKRENKSNHKELTAKVEQYNFNQGFRNNRSVSESLVKVKEIAPIIENNNEKIDIKPPRKKKNMFPLIILLMLLLIGGGVYYYLNFFNKKELTSPPLEQEEPPKEKEKQNKTTCHLALKMENQKQNAILEYIYYDKENKLKGYEQNTTFEYLEEVPKTIIEECNLTNKQYEGYEGYINKCVQNDELSYTFSIKVDLTKLEEKTLTFDDKTITISVNLDDDTIALKEEYENANYECNTEEVVIEE